MGTLGGRDQAKRGLWPATLYTDETFNLKLSLTINLNIRFNIEYEWQCHSYDMGWLRPSRARSLGQPEDKFHGHTGWPRPSEARSLASHMTKSVYTDETFNLKLSLTINLNIRFNIEYEWQCHRYHMGWLRPSKARSLGQPEDKFNLLASQKMNFTGTRGGRDRAKRGLRPAT